MEKGEIPRLRGSFLGTMSFKDTISGPESIPRVCRGATHNSGTFRAVRRLSIVILALGKLFWFNQYLSSFRDKNVFNCGRNVIHC